MPETPETQIPAASTEPAHIWGAHESQATSPKQAAQTPSGKAGPSNPSHFQAAATYTLSGPKRPTIKHDDGFLALGRRTASAGDYAKLAKWKAILEGAEAFRPGLTDGTAAYRHFLEGKGVDRQFSYERYVMNDSAGRTTLRNAILDIQHGAVDLWHANPTLTSFQLTGSAIPCGSGLHGGRFPYPATENWQKALGGHVIWLSGIVSVRQQSGADPQFSMTMTLHGEDRYNFNPGASDIATGVPDQDNGVFAMTGLAHQYGQFGVLRRAFLWRGSAPGVSKMEPSDIDRQRQPQNNRRLRNRL